MKRIYRILSIAILLICSTLLVSCGHYDSLEYELSEDGTYFIVTGASSQNCEYIEIPERYRQLPVKEIAESAFENCEYLYEVYMYDSITKIGAKAFKNCHQLNYVRMSENITSIEPETFSNCYSLYSVSFMPENVKVIGYEAFKNCRNLYDITIPDSVTSIGLGVLEGCDGLVELTIPFVGKTASGTTSTHFGHIFGASSYSYNYLFVPKSLETVVITGGESISKYAFYNCTKIRNVTLPSSLRSIGQYAFSECTSLTDITIPYNVTTIGYYAFNRCNSLTIYCEVSYKLSGWDPYWNPSNRRVYWGQ